MHQFWTHSVIPLSPVECSFVCFGLCNMGETDESCPFQNRGAQSKHVLFRKRKCGISTEWGLGLRRFSDSGSEENIVDSGEEFVPVDLKADSSDSDNNIFIFITGIRATCRRKLFVTVFGQFLLCCCDRERYVIWLYGLFIWQVHILSFLKMYMFIVLFLVVYLL